MKRFCLSVFAVASMLLAASCQQELNPVTDGDTTVTFTVSAGDVATRAIADGTNVDALHWEIYKTDDVATATQPLGEDTIIDKDGNKEFTVELKLLADQKYTIIFWAEVDGADHYDTEDLRNVAIKDYSNEKANDESRAAFFRVYPFETENGETITETVELYRPFSQINLGSTTYETSFNNVNGGNVKVETSEMTVTKIATSFNTLTGKGEGEQVVTFKANATPNAPADDTQKLLEVNDLYYYWIGMNYLIVCGDSDNVDVDITLDTNFGEVKHTISSVPVKENYRTNLLGNFLTTGATFNVVVDEEFNKPDEVVVVGSTVVRTSEELAAALKEDKEHINIFLDEVGNVVTRAGEKKEFEIAIDAWTEKYYFGGASTKTITINANGNKINFVHENTDWNYIRCVNDAAKWIINDATLTNSGKNDGPWNRHDIRFYNAVELNNVTSDKAIALLNDGKLNNVTITEETGAYGLWITAEGQKVDVNGLNITATNGGRGIAIKDQYVDAPACVTLNVENAKFETADKAAILVTSTAGATITLKDVDITNVAADSDFAVWVDEDRAAYADKVVVNGGLCKVEGSINDVVADTAKELVDNLKKDGSVVYLYPTADGKTLDTEKKLSLGQGASFIGVGDEPVAIVNTWSSDAFATQAHFTDTYVENIFFENNLVINAGIANGTVRFKNCVFGGDRAHQGVHFDSGEGTIVFDNCTFVGRNMFGSSLEKVIFNNCTFLNKKSSLTGADKWTGVNMWGKYEFNNCEFDTEAHCNVKCDGVVAAFNGCKFTDGREVTSIVNYTDDFTADITFDGKKYVAEGLLEDENGNQVASTEGGLKEALENGGTVVLANPFTIDQSESNGYGKTGINMTNGGTLDGNGNELGAPGSTGTWDSAINTSGGTIKNIKVTKGFRGIFIKKDSNHNEKLYLDNVTIDGTTYTISCDSGNGLGLEATNSTFKGWTSYAATLGNAKFTDCYFGAGAGYSYCRPYAPTEFVGCEFEAGFKMDARAAVTFENCTLDGVALTAQNIATLVVANTANATVK